ncbi:MAG: hypothetical protein ACYC36_03635 [Bellilinea sp.]
MMEHLIRYPKQQTEAEIRAGKPVEIISFMQEYDPDKPCLPRGVKDTSIDAYSKHKVSGKLNRQQSNLVEFMKQHDRDWTRQELATTMKWGINVICGRVKELLDLGSIIELPKRECAATGEQAHGLRINVVVRGAIPEGEI